jgi:hypothetical protein
METQVSLDPCEVKIGLAFWNRTIGHWHSCTAIQCTSMPPPYVFRLFLDDFPSALPSPSPAAPPTTSFFSTVGASFVFCPFCCGSAVVVGKDDAGGKPSCSTGPSPPSPCMSSPAPCLLRFCAEALSRTSASCALGAVAALTVDAAVVLPVAGAVLVVVVVVVWMKMRGSEMTVLCVWRFDSGDHGQNNEIART